MRSSRFSALFSSNDRSLSTCEVLNGESGRNNGERSIYSKNARNAQGETRRARVIGAERKLKEAEQAMTILNALGDKKWPTHAKDSLDIMLDRSEAAASTSTSTSNYSRISPNTQISRKRECIVLPLEDFPSLTRSPKRSRLNATSPFDTLNAVRTSYGVGLHSRSSLSPSLYARESLESSRIRHSFDALLPKSTIQSNRKSETEWHAEPGVPQIAAISDSSIESSSSEDTTDSLSSDSVNQRSIIEIDEPVLPVRPLFSRISFKKVTPACVNFATSDSEFERASEINRTRLKRLLGASTAKNSDMLKSALKKRSVEPIAPAPAPAAFEPAQVNFGADSSSQVVPTLKFSASTPDFSAAASFTASPNDLNLFTTTPLSTGSKPLSASNTRRKFPRR